MILYGVRIPPRPCETCRFMMWFMLGWLIGVVIMKALWPEFLTPTVIAWTFVLTFVGGLVISGAVNLIVRRITDWL